MKFQGLCIKTINMLRQVLIENVMNPSGVVGKGITNMNVTFYLQSDIQVKNLFK